MKQSECMQNSLPEDIALKIASSLQVSDVCSLGSCSRFWRELCGSDCIWASLCRDRWPALKLGKESSAPEIQTHELDQQMASTLQGWRGFYINKHNEMAGRAAAVVDFVEQCSSSKSMEVAHYLAAIEDLSSMQFGFRDIQMFLFKPKLNVLLNLVGLHYCISWLGVPMSNILLELSRVLDIWYLMYNVICWQAEYVIEALGSCKISERQVCVQWWKLGRWFYGFRLQDESRFCEFCLGDLAMAKVEEVLRVLHRGAIHEVLRIQISAAKPTRIPWSFQSAQREN